MATQRLETCFGAIRKFADGGESRTASDQLRLVHPAKNAIAVMQWHRKARKQDEQDARVEAMKAKYGCNPLHKPAQPQPSVQPQRQCWSGRHGGNSIDKRLKESRMCRWRYRQALCAAVAGKLKKVTN